MQEIEFLAPTSLAEALAALDSPHARPLAGGTDLIAQLREGRRRASRIVDLKRIPELMAVAELADGGLSIGAAASVSALAGNARARTTYPALVEAARLIGSFQIQNRASVGGNICNAAPSADAAPILICGDARAQIAGPGGRREVPLEDLFRGPGQTSLEAGELLVAVVLPPPLAGSATTYLRFTPRNEMDIAVAGVAAWLTLDRDGAIDRARVALASVAPTPIRAREAEQALACRERPTPALLAEAGRLAARAARPISDTRGSADYRRELTKVLTERALMACLAQLGTRVEAA